MHRALRPSRESAGRARVPCQTQPMEASTSKALAATDSCRQVWGESEDIKRKLRAGTVPAAASVAAPCFAPPARSGRLPDGGAVALAAASRHGMDAQHGRVALQQGVELLGAFRRGRGVVVDRKSTRLNSSHLVISYAVFCLKKNNKSPSASPVCSLANSGIFLASLAYSHSQHRRQYSDSGNPLSTSPSLPFSGRTSIHYPSS